MIAWIVLLVLVAAEVIGIRWWLRKEFYPVMFNGWAALIYSAILAADFVIAWLVSWVETPGGSTGTAFLAVIGLVLVVIVFLMTLFLRWVVRSDMTDVSEKQNNNPR